MHRAGNDGELRISFQNCFHGLQLFRSIEKRIGYIPAGIRRNSSLKKSSEKNVLALHIIDAGTNIPHHLHLRSV